MVVAFPLMVGPGLLIGLGGESFVVKSFTCCGNVVPGSESFADTGSLTWPLLDCEIAESTAIFAPADCTVIVTDT